MRWLAAVAASSEALSPGTEGWTKPSLVGAFELTTTRAMPPTMRVST